MKTIVVSAVNIRRGGTLRILRDCLEYLSTLASEKHYRIVAIVHRRSLFDYGNIEYLELPHVIDNWGKRLWCEYVTMNRISRELAPVYLWLSLHDTTPRVVAERQAVYCQTSFPFLRLRLSDIRFDYKICLFGLFTRYAYRMNIKKNKYIIVQADWLRRAFSAMFGIPQNRFIVSPPEEKTTIVNCNGNQDQDGRIYKFAYICGPDCHKNIELVCKAAEMLEKNHGSGRFQVMLTIAGSENAYARWIFSKWGNLKSINYMGYLNREELSQCYSDADCLIFPSRIETWGLPISEFMQYHKPMLLADLPYSHEASAGSTLTAFFNVDDASALAVQMARLIAGDTSSLSAVGRPVLNEPYSYSWEELFRYLLQ